MPINNNLPIVQRKIKQRFGESNKTQFKNNCESIKVTLEHATAYEDILKFIPKLLMSTWSDTPYDYGNLTLEQKEKIFKDLLDGKLLPTALEMINLVFRIDGMDLITVTHLIRHRTLSFAAQCSGDRFMNNDNFVIPTAIENSPEFYERYKKICEDAKQLYCDMNDSKQISIMDSRTILPRAGELFYYVRGNLKDIIAFIKQRLDRNIQPHQDNLIALYMWLEIVKQYPMAKHLVNIDAPPMHYINTARSEFSTNLYMPEKEWDNLMEYNENDFLYPTQRENVNGTDKELSNNRKVFEKILEKVRKELESL